MKLLPPTVAKKLPALYSQDGKGENAIAQVKFFDPCGSWTWYASEFDPETRTFFGIVVGHEREMGTFSLDELEMYRGRLGLGIERDIHWSPKPLKECV